MAKQILLVLFFISLIVNITSVQLGNETLQYFSKPLIVSSLLIYFLLQTKDTANGLVKWVALALVFSLMGDVLLIFVPKKDIFFLLGLSAFLIAHIFYIIFFHLVRIREKVKSNIWLLLIVVVYYAALIILLSPHLYEMMLPVRIYGIVISFMFMLAMHMLFIKNKIAGKWMMLGALLFVISDSVLAIDKFYKPFEQAGVIIMLTYGLAQLFIVKGAIGYIKNHGLTD